MSELFANEDQQTLASGQRYHGQVHARDARLDNNNMGNIKSALEYMLGGFPNTADIETPLESSYSDTTQHTCEEQPDTTTENLPELNYESETVDSRLNRLKINSLAADYQIVDVSTQEDVEGEQTADEESDEYDEESEHECTSDCEHSDCEEENQYEIEEGSEYEEYTDEDAERSDVEEEEREEEWSCNSECGDDCDGIHHVCDVDSDCDIEHEQSEHEEDEISLSMIEYDRGSDSEATEELEYNEDITPHGEGLSRDDCNGVNRLKGQSDTHLLAIPDVDIIMNSVSRPRLKPVLRSVSNKDIISELKLAIDTRVKRTSSLREMQSSDSPRIAKRNFSAPDTTDDPNDYLKKLDIGERDTRRKERRARLRTLELKREAFLDELREGHEPAAKDSLYKSSDSEYMPCF